MRELETELPSHELTEWLAYYRLEPFGAERDNWHSATIASILVNSNRKKNTPAVAVKEFMYQDKSSKREADTKGFFAGLRALGKRKG